MVLQFWIHLLQNSASFHPKINKVPLKGEIFSVNEANEHIMPKGVRKYSKYCHQLNNGKRTHTARFMGSSSC